MHVTLVHVEVHPRHIDDFIAATRDNHLAALNEPGNRRFDVLQSADDPSRFVLYEAYDSAHHAAAHKETPHYLRWRDRVASFMAKPREGKVFRACFPHDHASL